jgi:hypothetical protein
VILQVAHPDFPAQLIQVLAHESSSPACFYLTSIGSHRLYQSKELNVKMVDDIDRIIRWARVSKRIMRIIETHMQLVHCSIPGVRIAVLQDSTFHNVSKS